MYIQWKYTDFVNLEFGMKIILNLITHYYAIFIHYYVHLLLIMYYFEMVVFVAPSEMFKPDVLRYKYVTFGLLTMAGKSNSVLSVK